MNVVAWTAPQLLATQVAHQDRVSKLVTFYKEFALRDQAEREKVKKIGRRGWVLVDFWIRPSLNQEIVLHKYDVRHPSAMG